jgi:hypothetical protein
MLITQFLKHQSNEGKLIENSIKNIFQFHENQLRDNDEEKAKK